MIKCRIRTFKKRRIRQMPKNYLQVKRAQKEFQRSFFYSQEYFDFIKSIGISIVGMIDKDASQEDQSDFCLRVELKSPLPSELDLPNEYLGVKVYTHVKS